MAQQVKNVAGKFGSKGIGALLGLAGVGYAATQSFYSGEYLKPYAGVKPTTTPIASVH